MMTMTEKSKFLSYVLRHRPDEIGIVLDGEGWVDVAELLEKAAANGTVISPAELETIVGTSDKQRFTLSGDGARIRAAQGHSVRVELGLDPVTPPDRLYHGTAVTALASIRAEGLTPRGRQQVHLSADADTARKVGSRHGKPHVLAVDAARMHGDGWLFFQADNGVWLTEAVPTRYLADD